MNHSASTEGSSRGRWAPPRIIALLLLVVSCTLVGYLLIQTSWNKNGDSFRSTDARTQGTQAQITRKPNVIFIVLDTVRADHLSLCGYERPTSPTLELLAPQAKAWTCRAYAPASWTLPSHASFFTGEGVEVHGADSRPASSQLPENLDFVPLDGTLPTLAEKMKARGYRTVCLTANGVISKAAGLLRGFDITHVAHPIRQALYRGEKLRERIKLVLDKEAERRAEQQAQAVTELGSRHETEQGPQPLFLFVNIFDAHSPWAAVPEGLDWLPPQKALDADLKEEGPFGDYVRGKLQEPALSSFRQTYTNAYDYGIYVADQTLAYLISSLIDGGWLEDGYRIIISSDHGEYLAEYGLVGHGVYLHEVNTRVPFLYFSDADVLPDEGELELKEPYPAISAFDLALDPIRAQTRLTTAVGIPCSSKKLTFGPEVNLFDDTSVAIWQGQEKLLWQNGQVTRVDLASDPLELHPTPIENHPLLPELEAIAHRTQAMLKKETQPNQELYDRLRALGYAN